jgi:L-malate glycosyltransferase
MKIGIVCYPTFGGSGVIATELGKSMAEKGHAVHFIAYQPPARLDAFHKNIYYHEVRYSEYPLFTIAPYESALTSKIVDVVKFEKLDILHVHYAIPHAATAYMAKKILEDQGIIIPVITTLHGTDITLVGKDNTYSPVVTFSINQSDGVTTVSESLKNDTYDLFDIKKEIRIIPNFVDFSRFQKANKDHFRKAIAPNNEKIIVHTSNFRKPKRVEDAVLAFHEIRKQIPAKLLLIGDGPERQHLEQLCREMGECEHIRFLGKQDAVEEILSLADLFFLPSENESFGLAALEAMACHVPVISSDAGGIPEFNVHGETGFISNIGDVKDMAKNAMKLLSNDELLNTFRENAFNKSKEYALEKIMPLYESYYIEIIEKVKSEADKVSV